MNGGGFMKVLNYTPTDHSIQWTCDFWNEDLNNVTDIFTMEMGVVTQVNITGWARDYTPLIQDPGVMGGGGSVPSVTNTATTSSTAVFDTVPTSSSESKHPSEGGMMAAAVVSALLSLLLIAAIGALVWERRRRAIAEKELEGIKIREHNINLMKSEIKTEWAPPAELPGVQTKKDESGFFGRRADVEELP
jgi:hypothetical protein